MVGRLGLPELLRDILNLLKVDRVVLGLCLDNRIKYSRNNFGNAAMNAIISMLPEWAKAPLRSSRNAARRLLLSGSERFCPICGKSSRRFLPSGVAPRDDAQCARCGSLERHRLLWLFVLKRTDLFDGRRKRVLHVAAEPCLEIRFKERLGRDYLTADLFNPKAMVKMDISAIDYPDETFDVIYCSHVLEHVPDDRKAMREFCRTLKRGGWSILLVPITSDRTYEDPSITSPEDRLKIFGQEDHVRNYGPDYVDRLRESGFEVEVVAVGDLAGKEDAIRMGLTSATGEIYICRKRQTGDRRT